MKAALIIVVVLIAAFVATTWWALESGGVAVIETSTQASGVRSTHVWYAEPDGSLWIEAGTPENGWFLDVQENPVVTFEADRRFAKYLARPVEGPSGHSRIRSLLREKYGLRDRWVGLLVDTSRSIAVELVPVDE